MEVQLSIKLKPIRVPSYIHQDSTVVHNDDGGAIDVGDIPDGVLCALADEFKKNLLEHARTRRLNCKTA